MDRNDRVIRMGPGRPLLVVSECAADEPEQPDEAPPDASDGDGGAACGTPTHEADRA